MLHFLLISLAFLAVPTSGQFPSGMPQFGSPLNITGKISSCGCGAASSELRCTNIGLTTEMLVASLNGHPLAYYCPMLTQILFDGNELTSPLPGDLLMSNSLKMVDISSNHLTELPVVSSYLSSFYAHGNSISRIPSSFSTGWKNLTTLLLANNPSTCQWTIDPGYSKVSVVCSCAPGYVGFNFCEPLESFILIPAVSSELAGFRITHPAIKNGYFNASIQNAVQGPSNAIFQLTLKENNAVVNFSAPVIYSSFEVNNQSWNPFSRLSLPAANITLDTTLNSVLPSHTFEAAGNPIAPTSISYQLVLMNGIALPAGVKFNADETSLIGTPTKSVHNAKYQVYAKDGFTGETKLAANISLNVKDCGSQTCANKGKCVDNDDPYDNVFTCSCSAGTRGIMCEVIDTVPPVISKCPLPVLKIVSSLADKGRLLMSDFNTSVVSDNFGGSLLTSYEIISKGFTKTLVGDSDIPVGRYSVRFSVSDEAQNMASCTFTVSFLQQTLSEDKLDSMVGYQGSLVQVPLLNVASFDVLFLYSLINGSLPVGMMFDTVKGRVVGTPLDVATKMTYYVRICDPLAVSTSLQVFPSCDQVEVSLTVLDYEVLAETSSLTPDGEGVYRLPSAVLNENYSPFSFKFGAVGGSGCIHFELDGDTTLPEGLQLNGQGIIMGTPNEPGTFVFRILATDSSTVSVLVNNGAYFSITVDDCNNDTCVHGTCVDQTRFDGQFSCSCDPQYIANIETGLCVTPSGVDSTPPKIMQCPNNVVKVVSQSTSKSTFLVANFTFVAVDESGPVAASFYFQGSKLSTTVSLNPGRNEIEFRATDTFKNVASCKFYVSVLQMKVSSSLQSNITLYQGTTSTVELISIPTPVYTFTVLEGEMPRGVNLDAKTGSIVGTPLAASSRQLVKFKSCDGLGDDECDVVAIYLTVVKFQVTFNGFYTKSMRRSADALPFVIDSIPMYEDFSTDALNVTLVGGSGCVSFKVTNGSLPAGLKMGWSGAITGKPTQGGNNFVFQIEVTDASTVSALVNDGEFFSLVVHDCDTSTNEPCGEGVCVDSVPFDSQYSCNCDPGYIFSTAGSYPECVVDAAAASSGSSSSNIVPLAAGIGGAAAFLIIVVIIFVLIAYRRALREKPHNFEAMLEMLQAYHLDQEGPKTPRELDRSTVTILEDIGKGNFGTVSKGIFEDKPSGLGIKLPGFLVAIKVLRSKDSVAKTELLEEALTMAQFNHPNVVSLVGVVTVGEPVMMVLEYMEHGSLQSYLKHTATNERQKLQFATDIASGLCYLSALGFIHRDVATRNVLLNSEYKAKVSDFGMSRDASDSNNYYRSQGGNVPVRWCSPEALEERKFSEASDVWAYGITLYEIWMNAGTPYEGWSNQKVWVEVLGGYRLPAPPGCPMNIALLMRECWQQDPSLRPAFSEIPDYVNDPQAFQDRERLPSIYADFGLHEDVKALDDSDDMKKPNGSQKEEIEMNNLPSGTIANPYMMTNSRTSQDSSTSDYTLADPHSAKKVSLPPPSHLSSLPEEESPYLEPTVMAHTNLPDGNGLGYLRVGDQDERDGLLGFDINQ